jgi:hypothetical protein
MAFQECSGCGKLSGTVNRNLFDGTCPSCTNKALFNEDFAKYVNTKNKEIIGKQKK